MTPRSPKILLVDDSEICRETIKYQLGAYGFEVIALDSPFGFGAALSKEQPDLVLVDAQMPALTGDKLVEIARKNKLCSCPIVIHSDRAPRDLAALVASCGAAGYISKTDDAHELVRAVSDYLSRGEPSDPSSRTPQADSQKQSSRDQPTDPLERKNRLRTR